MAFWVFTTARFTVGVVTDGERIIRAAPIVGKFIGQPIGNLIGWVKRQGGIALKVSE